MEIKQRAAFEAIGTRWDIQIGEAVEPEAWSELLQRIRARIDEFDKAYSRFRPDSLVTRMSQEAGSYDLPEDGHKLLRFYEELYRLTDGRVTPLIGQVVSDAGYDAAYSFTHKPLHQPPRWEDVIDYDTRHITMKQPALLDFGAAGKGYLVDIIGDLLEQAGVRTFTINAGGDILHRSAENEAIDVGLENPADMSEAIGIIKLGNASVCASSGSKRRWPGFHHIIDPGSLESADHILAAWVLADDTMTADGLATALFFTSPQALLDRFRFSYAVLDKDMSLSFANDLPVTLFEAE